MVHAAAVLGAGSWGTALAKLLADKGTPVRLWARRPEQAAEIAATRENRAYLPGFTLPPTLDATADLGAALEGAELVLLVVPSHGLRELLHEAAPALPREVPIVAAIKGIENGSLALVSEVLAEALPPTRHADLAFLGGPSFAKEVAAGVPTAVSIAGKAPATTARAQEAMSTDRFRVYTTEDVVGVEVGGAMKNVIAIAAGIADGLGFGHNTRAALITRGLAEIARLALRKGADPLTVAGLGGMGDLVLTCTGDLSRNRTVGLELGRGRSLADVLGGMQMVAEGVRTAKSAHMLAVREGVDMPITAAVHDVLYEGLAPLAAVESLMRRPLKPERR